VLHDKELQLADGGDVFAEGEAGADQVLCSDKPGLIEPGCLGTPPFAGTAVSQSLATPQRQRGLQQLGRRCQVSCC
jgi:hypothetical protein